MSCLNRELCSDYFPKNQFFVLEMLIGRVCRSRSRWNFFLPSPTFPQFFARVCLVRNRQLDNICCCCCWKPAYWRSRAKFAPPWSHSTRLTGFVNVTQLFTFEICSLEAFDRACKQMGLSNVQFWIKMSEITSLVSCFLKDSKINRLSNFLSK